MEQLKTSSPVFFKEGYEIPLKGLRVPFWVGIRQIES